MRSTFAEPARRMTIAAAVVVACVQAPTARAQQSASIVFRNPTFEQLASATVTSVARKEQSYFSTSAAVYVIGNEEIRRSGVRSIPEALRLAPGVEVARISPHRYAVSIRGFNNEFTTKLLVLQDGRSLYTPLFAGTFWDMQDTLLDDVERIEIVRGPGGTAWGVNAVNGVINIVTKKSTDTRGIVAIGGAGTEERAFGSFRYGGDFFDSGAYRAYVHSSVRDEGEFANGLPADDAWRQTRAGFRIDTELSNRDRLAVLGEVYDGSADQLFRNAPTDVDIEGMLAMGRWERATSSQDLSLQLLFDTSRRETYQGIADRTDWALEVVDRLHVIERHDITLGFDYRTSRNEARTAPGLSFSPPSRNSKYVGAFIDDAVRFLSDRLTFSAGIKFERNDFTGTERLPNVRISWQPNERQMWWAAVTEGARIPSIADNDSTASLPGLLSLPNKDLPAEKVRAFEAGWRRRDGERWSIDLTAFFNDYEKLRTRETSFIASPPTVVRTRDSMLDGKSVGVEAVVVVQATRDWRIQIQGSYLDVHLELLPGSTDRSAPDEVGVSPRWQGAIRNSFDLGSSLQLQAGYRYVDALRALQVPAYHALDVRAAWQMTDRFEASLCGQNLLSSRHAEFRAAATQPPASEVERGVYLQFRLDL